MNNIKGTFLYIGGFELPDKNAAAQRVITNAKLLKYLGYDTVFIGVGSEESDNVISTKQRIDCFCTYFMKHPRTISEWIHYISDIDEYKRVACTIPNIVGIICYNFPAFALNKIRKLCAAKKWACIADVTEWYGGKGRSFPLNIIKSYESWYRMNIVHKRMDGLIVISYYLQSFYSNEKTLLLPPLTNIDDSKWRECNNQHNDDEVLYLCYAGNPGRKDKIDLLIDAITLVKRKIHIDIIGISKEDYLSLYPKYRHLLSDGRISFHGRLTHLEALDYVKQANYCCFFRENNRTTKAGFPTKFSESITAGTPVLTNNTSDIRHYITEGKNGIVFNHLDASIIAKTIEELDYSFPVNRTTFDYRNYKEICNQWLGKVLL